MKVMTYNILEGGVDVKVSRIQYIIDVIKEEEPDFLALQEANNFDKNSNELLKKVSKETKLPYYILSPGRLDENQKRYHVVNLSRYPMREVYMFPNSIFQSAALCVVVDSLLGELSLCNVHLHANSEDKRLTEIETVLEYQFKFKNSIILGDHNAISRTDDHDDFSDEECTHYDLNRFDVTDMINKNYTDTIFHLGSKDRSTSPTVGVGHPISKSSIRIDYIFVTSSLASKIKSGNIIKTETSENASDHYPAAVMLH